MRVLVKKGLSRIGDVCTVRNVRNGSNSERVTFESRNLLVRYQISTRLFYEGETVTVSERRATFFGVVEMAHMNTPACDGGGGEIVAAVWDTEQKHFRQCWDGALEIAINFYRGKDVVQTAWPVR
jgi:hypothetical protein